jgi:hypothetical protein
MAGEGGSDIRPYAWGYGLYAKARIWGEFGYVAMPAVAINGRTYEEVAVTSRSGAALDVEPLGVPSVARQLTAGSASANTALTTTCRRISIKAVGADIRYAIGSSSQTASATSHFIGNGERLDLAVPATPNIAVLRNGSTDGTLELTELS